MSNVPELLKSKRFWVSLLGLVVIVVSAFEPTLATKFNEIVPAVLVIVGFLVGGYSLEDAVTAYNPIPTTTTSVSLGSGPASSDAPATVTSVTTTNA